MADLSLVAAWQRATHHLLTALDAELAGSGLTPGEINALACFGGEKAVAVGELIARTGQRRSTFTGVLDRLERRGLIERRPHPQDRRSSVAALTRDGARTAAAVAAAVERVEARLPAKVRAAARALQTIDDETLLAP